MSGYAHLVLQLLSSGLLCLLLVDELHQDPLVLEHVSLSLEVQLVVEMAVDLLGLPRTEDLSEIFQLTSFQLELSQVQ